jgi:hypothetical protein
MRGNPEQNDDALFFLSIRGLKQGETVHITQVQTTETKGVYKELPNINQVSGVLVRTETKTREYKDGSQSEEVRLWLRDPNEKETYILSVGLNMIGRSIINLLAGVEGKIGDVMIRVYNNKDTGRQAVYMEVDGTKSQWKYNYNEETVLEDKTVPPLSTMVTPIKKKKKVDGKMKEVVENDYFELNEFMLKVFREEVAYKVDKAAAYVPSSVPPTTAVAINDGAEPNDESGDDLPF